MRSEGEEDGDLWDYKGEGAEGGEERTERTPRRIVALSYSPAYRGHKGGERHKVVSGVEWNELYDGPDHFRVEVRFSTRQRISWRADKEFLIWSFVSLFFYRFLSHFSKNRQVRKGSRGSKRGDEFIQIDDGSFIRFCDELTSTHPVWGLIKRIIVLLLRLAVENDPANHQHQQYRPTHTQSNNQISRLRRHVRRYWGSGRVARRRRRRRRWRRRSHESVGKIPFLFREGFDFTILHELELPKFEIHRYIKVCE